MGVMHPERAIDRLGAHHRDEILYIQVQNHRLGCGNLHGLADVGTSIDSDLQQVWDSYW